MGFYLFTSIDTLADIISEASTNYPQNKLNPRRNCDCKFLSMNMEDGTETI